MKAWEKELQVPDYLTQTDFIFVSANVATYGYKKTQCLQEHNYCGQL